MDGILLAIEAFSHIIKITKVCHNPDNLSVPALYHAKII